MRLREWRVCTDAHAQRSCAHEQSPPCFRCFWARRTACARCPSGTGAGSGRIRHRLRAGEQVSLGRPVAVKIDSRPLHDERNRRRFMREMAAASRISGHPNAVSLIDSGVLPDGRPYLVMERCDGGSLAQVLQHGEISAAQAVSIVTAVCSALGAAHDAGVLHRDIKPGNILIDAYGSPRLSDFGLAAVQHEGIDSSVTLETMTPDFAPPEAFTLAAPSPRGDVWSMGAVLFALLTGRGPRRTADGAPQSLPEIINHLSVPIDTSDARIPEALRPLLDRALHPDPAQRYRDGNELTEALTRAGGLSNGAFSTPHSALRDSHPLPAVISTPTAGSRRSSRALMLLALGGDSGRRHLRRCAGRRQAHRLGAVSEPGGPGGLCLARATCRGPSGAGRRQPPLGHGTGDRARLPEGLALPDSRPDSRAGQRPGHPLLRRHAVASGDLSEPDDLGRGRHERQPGRLLPGRLDRLRRRNLRSGHDRFQRHRGHGE